MIISPAYEVLGWVYCFQLVRDSVIPDFISAQYLENELMESDILHMALTITRSRLGLLRINFRKFIT